MTSRIFREKSMDQLSSPDQLTDYLRVTGPGIWFLLCGILILLAGLLVWGTFGQIAATADVPALIRNGEAACYLLEDDAHFEDDTIPIRIGDQELSASADNTEKVTLEASDDPALFATGYLSPGKNAVVLYCPTSLDNGYYEAAVTTETLKPLSLLFSKN